MKPALVLVDLQHDFLSAVNLQPAPAQIVQATARLLEGCRWLRVPVVHVWTSVQRDPDNRMPHWRAMNRWMCEVGTPGHKTPAVLTPRPDEPIVHKQFFSGFGSSKLHEVLQSVQCDTLLLAGLHLHACVRATALDAYDRGYGIYIVEDAVASDDPIHAAITQRYLSSRGANFLPVAQILNALETPKSGTLPPAPPALKGLDQLISLRRAQKIWRQTRATERLSAIERLVQCLQSEEEDLARLITQELGKPITMARAEMTRSVALLHATADRASDLQPCHSGDGASYRFQPLGTVAVVTPWNNPVAIPLGKIAPAILYGNAVMWKPAPQANQIAERLMELFRQASWQAAGDDLVSLLTGDRSVARTLAADARVDGVTLSGSLGAGYALQEICARRHVPFQGELGGNNAAIVWEDADLIPAARQIAAGAFGFAGQRCTANRRVIVAEKVYDRFVDLLQAETAALRWGDPFDPAVVIGPLIHADKADEVARLVRRTEASKGMKVLVPHREQRDYQELITSGAYFPPTIVLADDAEHEIVQEETFGPVLVVRRAADFDEALQLLNGVRQGLVAAIFTTSSALQQRFLDEARAGVLKINRSTVDADATSPLGGWKASGVGPAEHGPCDREFFCRVQTIYRP